MKNENTLTVHIKTKGKRPYSKDAPVQAIYTSLNPILGQLVYTNQNYDLRPGLLKSFKWNHKTGSYILRLQEGLIFHNGRKATARDLEFSILRGFFTSKRSFFAAFFNNIKGIEQASKVGQFKPGIVSGVNAINEHEVEIKIKQPNPSFLHSLNRPFFSLTPMEALDEQDYQVWKDGPVGVGAYKLIKSNKKNEMVLKKISSKSSGTDFIKINFSDSEDQNFDIKINNAQDNSAYKAIFSERATAVTNIMFNFNNVLGADLNFRKALNHAIDRDRLVENNSIFKSNAQFLASHFWGRIDTVNGHDPIKGKGLLKNIPSLNSDKEIILKIPVFNSSFGDKKLGGYLEILRAQLSQIGLNVTFFDSKDKFFSKDNKETPFRIVTLGADVVDPVILFGLMRGKSSPLWPHFPRNDVQYEKLLNVAKDAVSLDKKALATQELSKYFYKNKISVPLFERKMFVSIKRDRIKSVGLQDGGITFYLDRVELNKDKQ